GYDCNEKLEIDGEKFTVETTDTVPTTWSYWGADWTKTLPEKVNLHLFGHFPDGLAEANTAEFDPIPNFQLSIGFDPDRYSWRRPPPGKPAKPDLVMEISVGTQSIRTWADEAVVVFLGADNIRYLMQGEGDFRVKAYTSTQVVQEAAFPRATLQRVIDQLKKMDARAREKAADQKNLCRAFEYDIIVVT